MIDLVKARGKALVAGEAQYFDDIDEAVATAKAAWEAVARVLDRNTHNRKSIIEGFPMRGYSVRMPFRCAEKPRGR